jgi:hypothetical protein
MITASQHWLDSLSPSRKYTLSAPEHCAFGTPELEALSLVTAELTFGTRTMSSSSQLAIYDQSSLTELLEAIDINLIGEQVKGILLTSPTLRPRELKALAKETGLPVSPAYLSCFRIKLALSVKNPNLILPARLLTCWSPR